MRTQRSTAASPRPIGAGIVGKDSENASGPGPEVMAASTLACDKILSADGEQVGRVKEIMLDVQAGRIAYVVMSCGGFLGIGDRLLAIPWSALTLDTTRKCFLLSLSSERVKSAPGFDKDHWPSMAEHRWASTVHQYYGTTAANPTGAALAPTKSTSAQPVPAQRISTPMPRKPAA